MTGEWEGMTGFRSQEKTDSSGHEKTHRTFILWASFLVAEAEGFEPPVRLHGLRFSRPTHSTTLPHLRGKGKTFLKTEATKKSIRVYPLVNRILFPPKTSKTTYF